MTGGHFTLDELRACARGEDESLRSAVIEHCRTCKDCGDKLAALLVLNQIKRHRSRLGKLSSSGLVKVAAVLLLITALGVVMFPRTPPTTADDLDALRALATTEPPKESFVRFQIGTELPVGSADTQARLLAAGLALADRNYADAVSQLERLHEERPGSVLVDQYLGMALYLSGDDSERVGELLARGALDHDKAVWTFSQWYLANHLLRRGDVKGARALLEELVPIRQRPGRLALGLLARLDHRDPETIRQQ